MGTARGRRRLVDDTHTVAITVADVDEDGNHHVLVGSPFGGTVLTATLEDDDGVVLIDTWLWQISDDGQANWTTISDADTISDEDTSSYTPGSDDIGKNLRVTVTYEDLLSAVARPRTGETAAVATAPRTNQNPEFHRYHHHPFRRREYPGGHEHWRSGSGHAWRQRWHAGILAGYDRCGYV